MAPLSATDQIAAGRTECGAGTTVNNHSGAGKDRSKGSEGAFIDPE